MYTPEGYGIAKKDFVHQSGYSMQFLAMKNFVN